MAISTEPAILFFSSSEIKLSNSGGKGLHLGELTARGFSVPPGFIITTSAYNQFCIENLLYDVIRKAVQKVQPENFYDLNIASEKIRTAFRQGQINSRLKDEILQGYRKIGAPAVAVRSSATAEDLAELSFAGQQDTFLNINSETLLLSRVIDCWSSLWTARAIGYRIEHEVDQSEIALAVVVQKMVQSEVSGVLFTANPLNGSRMESVIDATFGLGEALVSGLVDPDHYVVDTKTGKILVSQIGRKALSIHADENGGVKSIEETSSDLQALSNEQILELVQVGQRVQQAYGFPQDIEWGYSEGNLYLLQTRMITSLFPLPEGMPPEPLLTLVSFAAVQGMVDPLTPIGQSALKQVVVIANENSNSKVDESTQRVLYTAAERLWINFTPIVRNSFGRKVIPYIFTMVEPTIKQAVDQILDDPRLLPEKEGISWRARRQIIHLALPVAGNVILNLLSPARRRRKIVAEGESVLKLVEVKAAAIDGNRYEKLMKQTELLPEIARAHLGKVLTLFVSGVASGMVSWNALRMVTKKDKSDQSFNWGGLVMEVTRGMPYNPTTEMDLKLWEMAKSLRTDGESVQLLKNTSNNELASRYLKGDLPLVMQQEVEQFLGIYGGRGLCEIDLGRTRWAEDPTHVFEMLTNFVKIENENEAPDTVFSKSKAKAEEAIKRLQEQVRSQKRGWLKTRQVQFLAGRVRQLMGLRENPKFFAVRMMWIIHREILKTGTEFVAAGELKRADDLFYLSFSELKAFARQEKRDWQGLIDQRRIVFERELKRKQLPRLLLSDGRAFYEGLASQPENDSNVIMGSPVSPGVVEGRVRVVRDPGKAGLQRGEILVCPGTDPSWTPLFLLAGGLAMEVGGMMTHGAVVAREYGIPAIVGVHEATSRLKTGMKIRLNGSTGEIILLDEDNASGIATPTV